MLLNEVGNVPLPFVNSHHQPLPDILPCSPRLQRHQFYVLLMQYYLLRRSNSLLSLLSDYQGILSTLTFTSVSSSSLTYFGLLLLFFFFWSHFSHLIFEPWHQVWTQMLSQVLLLFTAYPLLWRIPLVSKKCLLLVLPCILPENSSWPVHPAVSAFEPCISQPEALLSSRLTHMCPSEWLPVHWVMQFVLCHLSPQAIHSHSWFCFCLFCATTDGFSFPTQQLFILNWKWIFNCCFIDFGLMSLWCFTPLTWLFCRLCFLKTNDIPHH